MRAVEGWTRCELCQREVPPQLITQHHLTPKEKGGKPDDRVTMCRPCHKQVHALFGNTDLARVHNTVPALRALPELQRFIKWVRKQPVQTNVTTRQSNDHPRARVRR